MNRILTTALAGCLGLGLVAQDDTADQPTTQPTKPGPSQKKLKKLRAAKLDKAVFKLAPWITDFTEARQKALDEEKLVFAYFTRSYEPCSHCEALEDGALSDPAFLEFADKVVLFLHVTSRTDDEPLPNLLTEKGFQGFPSLAFVDGAGKIVMSPKGRTVADFEQGLQDVRAVGKLRQDVARSKGEQRTKLEAKLFIAEAKHEMIDFTEATKRYFKVKANMSPEQQKRAENLMHFLEFRLVQKASVDLGDAGVVQALKWMSNGKRVPQGKAGIAFWRYYINSAIGAQNKPEAEFGLAELEKIVEPSDQRMIDYYKGELQKLDG